MPKKSTEEDQYSQKEKQQNTEAESKGSLASKQRARLMKRIKDNVETIQQGKKLQSETEGKPLPEKARILLERKISLAGHDPELAEKLSLRMFFASVAITVALSIFIISQYFFSWQRNLPMLFAKIAGVWIVAFAAIMATLWFIAYMFFELKIYQRRKEVEKVLPEFLQLTSSNIRSGMTIDMALWHAVKPKFGVLSYEIEMVAKEVMAGADLTTALEEFAEKYSSNTVKRTIALMIEGIQAGGELGDLLNQISIDLTDNQIMKKEMSADVTTYVIFIGMATLIGAPFLFGLAYNLVDVVQNIMGSVDMPSGGMGGGLGGFSPGEGKSIKLSDFKIFAVTMLSMTATMSAIITATIKKGTAKESLKYIPIFIGTAIGIFFIVSALFAQIMSGMF